MLASSIRSKSFSEFFWCSSRCFFVSYNIFVVSAVMSAASSWATFSKTAFLWTRTALIYNGLYLYLLIDTSDFTQIFSSFFLFLFGNQLFGFFFECINFRLKFSFLIVKLFELFLYIGPCSLPLNFLINIWILLFWSWFFFRFFIWPSENFGKKTHFNLRSKKNIYKRITLREASKFISKISFIF